MIDIYFIEFYIQRKYNKKLEDYFGVVSSVAEFQQTKKQGKK